MPGRRTWRAPRGRGRTGDTAVVCLLLSCCVAMVSGDGLRATDDDSLQPSYPDSDNWHETPSSLASLTPPTQPDSPITTTSTTTSSRKPPGPDLAHDLGVSSSTMAAHQASSTWSASSAAVDWANGPSLSPEMVGSILCKLLDAGQLRSLSGGSGQVEAQGCADSGALRSMSIVGLSPRFSAALRYKYQMKIKEQSEHVQPVPPSHRVRRQAEQGVKAEIVNVTKDEESGETTLDFLLKTEDGEVIDVTTAMQTLQSLSRDEMSALLGVPVISDIEAITVSANMTLSIMMSTMRIMTPSASLSVITQSPLESNTAPVESVISVHTVDTASYSTSVINIVPTSVLTTSLTTSPSFPIESQQDESSIFQTLASSMDFTQSILGSSEQSVFPELSTLPFLTNSVYPSASDLFRSSGLVSVTTSMHTMVPQLSVTSSLPEPAQSSPSGDSVFSSSSRQSAPPTLSLTADVASSQVMVSPSPSPVATSRLSGSSGSASSVVFPTPSLAASESASLSSVITEPPQPKPTSFLRLRIRVPPGTNVTSPAFLERMREAIEQMYSAALGKQQTSRRRKRQAAQVDVQIVNVTKDEESGETTLDFFLKTEDGEVVDVTTALQTLQSLSRDKMSSLLGVPVISDIETITVSANMTSSIMMSTMHLTSPSASLSTITQSPLESSTVPVESVISVHTVNTASYSTSVSNIVPTSVLATSLTTSPRVPTESQHDESSIFQTLSSSMDFSQSILDSSEQSVFPELSTGPFLTDSVHSSASGLFQSSGLVSVTTSMHSMVPQLSVTSSLLEPVQSSPSGDSVFSSFSRQSVPPTLSPTADVVSSHVMVSPSPSPVATSRLPESPDSASSVVFPTASLAASGSASLSSVITEPPQPKPTSFLRLRIRVPPGTDVTSPAFWERMKEAIEKMYLAALRKQQTGRRRKRQADQVDAQIVDVTKDDQSGETTLDFLLKTEDGEVIDVTTAMQTLQSLSRDEMSALLGVPVVSNIEAITVSANMTPSIMMSTMPIMTPSASLSTIDQSPLESSTVPVESVISVHTADTASYSTSVSNAVPTSVLATSLTTSLGVPTESQHDESSIFQTLASSMDFSQSILDSSEQSMFPELSTLPFLTDSVYPSASDLFRSSGLVSVTTIMDTMVPQLSVTRSLPEPVQSSPSVDSVFSSSSRQSAPPSLSPTADVASSQVMASPSPSPVATSRLPESSGSASSVVFPTPSLAASGSASLSSVITEPPQPKPTSFLRLRIRVPPGTDVTSPAFLERMREALKQMYLAALRKQQTGRRRKRQADQVDAQIVDATKDEESGETTLDFFLKTEDGEVIDVTTAMQTLQSLSRDEMSALLGVPVISDVEAITGSANMTPSIMMSTMPIMTPSASFSTIDQSPLESSTAPVESVISVHTADTASYSTLVSNIVPTSVHRSSLTTSPRVPTESQHDESSVFQTFASSTSFSQSILDSSEQSVFPELSTGPFLTDSVHSSASGLFQSSGLVSVTTSMHSMVPQLSVTSSLPEPVQSSPSGDSVFSSSSRQSVPSTADVVSSHVMVSPSPSPVATSRLPESSGSASSVVFPTPSLAASGSASLSSIITEPPQPKPTSFLRLRIRVPPGTDVTSPAFLERMEEAIKQMYLAALRKQQTGRRRKRQADQVDAQLLGVAADGAGEVTVDFQMEENGQVVPTDTALDTLNTLDNQEMSDIVTFPVVSLTKETMVSATITVLHSLSSSLVAVTSGDVVVATTHSSSMPLPTSVLLPTSVPVSTSKPAPTSVFLQTSVPPSGFTDSTGSSSVTSEVASSTSRDVSSVTYTSGPVNGSSSVAIPVTSVHVSPSASMTSPSTSSLSATISEALSTHSGAYSSVSESVSSASAVVSSQSAIVPTRSAVMSTDLLLTSSDVITSLPWSILTTSTLTTSASSGQTSGIVVSPSLSGSPSSAVSDSRSPSLSTVAASSVVTSDHSPGSGHSSVILTLPVTSSVIESGAPPVTSVSVSSGLFSESFSSVTASGEAITPSFDTSSVSPLIPSDSVLTTTPSQSDTLSSSQSSMTSTLQSMFSSPVFSVTSRTESGVLISSSTVSVSSSASGDVLPTFTSSAISSFVSTAKDSDFMTLSMSTIFTASPMSSSLSPSSSAVASSSAERSSDLGPFTTGVTASTEVASLSSSALSSSSSGFQPPEPSSAGSMSPVSSSLTSTFPLSSTSTLPTADFSTSSTSVITTTTLVPSTPTMSTSQASSSPVRTTTTEASAITTSTAVSSASVFTSTPVMPSTSTSTPPESSTSIRTLLPVESSTSMPVVSSSRSTPVEPSTSVPPESSTRSTPVESSTSIPPESSTRSTSVESSTVTSTSTAAASSTSVVPTWTISPTPPSSTISPSSSVGPDPEDVRNALLRVDLVLTPDQDEQEAEFKDGFERGMAVAYQRASQSRRKRNALPYDVTFDRGRHSRRHVRQAGPQTEATMTDVTRNSSDPRVTNVTFYMSEDGKPIPASNATTTLNKLTPNALSAILGYPVMSPVRAVYNQPQPEEPFDDDVGLLFIVAIVLPCVLLLLLVLVLVAFLFRSCQHDTADQADAVGTKYQRGETLDDYNLHVDVELGEIVDRTPGHTPLPNSRRHSQSKSPLPSLGSDKDDTLDSKRRMIDQWLRKDHRHCHELAFDSDSVAKSDTYLYARPKERKKPALLEAGPESYKNEDLQALKMPETSLTEVELTGDVDASGRRSDNFALQKRSVEGEKSPQSPRQAHPPQAKPRSFMGKLRDSVRKRKRSATPDCNTQSTEVSAAAGGGSSHNLADRSTSRGASAEREAESRTHHTDASNEFTFAMMPPRTQSESSSRERLESPDSDQRPVPSRHAPFSKDQSSKEHSRDIRPEPRSGRLRETRRSSTSSSENDEKDLRDRHSHDIKTRELSASKDYDDSTLPAGSKARGPDRDTVPILRAIETQTSLASSSDDSRRDDVRVKSVAVGPSGVNRKTQTPAPRDTDKDEHRRKPVTSERVAVRPWKHPLWSSMSGSDTQGSTVSMEEEQLEEEFPPERIEPFAKMSQVATTPVEREATIPVKFRRNIFEDGPPMPDTAEGDLNVEKRVYYKPAHHMRAQPRAAYSTMDPDQRREAELLDTALARQQMLLRQQQEVMAYNRRQQLDQQAQQLVNSSLAVGTTSTTPANQQLQPQVDNRQKLTSLLNEACLLAPQMAPPAMQPQPLPGNFQPGGMVWTPTPPVISAQGYFNNPMTILGGPAVGAPAPGAPGGFMVMNQEELMQAVRKELKRMQKE